MSTYFKITVLVLHLIWVSDCIGQNPDYKLKDLFQLKPEEARTKKVKSCSSVIYYTTQGDTSCSFGDYFVFDTAGRIVGQMICSEGGWPNTKTYKYDLATNKLAETREYKSFVTAEYEMDQTSVVEGSDRDSMLRNSRLQSIEIWRKDKHVHTTHFDEDGNVTWTIYPVLDEHDSIVQVRNWDSGAIRNVWVYRPNGKLLTDTTFDTYNGMIVQTYNEFGHPVTTVHYDTSGVVYRRESTAYKYDSNGREIDKVEINNKGKIDKHTITTFDVKGKIASIVVSNDTGMVVRSYSRKVQIIKKDTLITEQSLYYFKSVKQYSINNTTYRTIPSPHSVEKTVTEYKTDADKNIIGDTTKEFQVTVFNKRGDAISGVKKIGGVEKSTYHATYDSIGRPLERVRTGKDRPSRETFTYYPDGTSRAYTYEAYGNIQTTSYNSDGKIIRESKGIINNPERRVVLYTFDPNGLLIRREVIEHGMRSVLTIFSYTFF